MSGLSCIEIHPCVVPSGWVLSFEKTFCSFSPSIRRTGGADSFDAVAFEADLSGILNSDSCFISGSRRMGKAMRKYALPAPGEDAVSSGLWTLFRVNEHDFLLFGIASWRLFSGEFRVGGTHLEVRFTGDGKIFSPGETIPLEEIFFIRSKSEKEALDSYADFVREKFSVRLIERMWRGWGTWDYYGTRFSDRVVRENREELLKLSRNVNLIQIDDGYCKWGDWMEINPMVFPEGLPSIVRENASERLETGIWFAPFLASSESHLFRNHPEWFLHREDGSPLFGWSSNAVLDYSQDVVVDYIRKCVRSFLNAGITYFKLDFLASGTMYCVGKNPMTPYERFHRCLGAIREEAGKNIYLLGCSAEFAPCIGHVDGMRVGPDISPNFNQVRVSARCCESSFPFHRKWFQCDTDYLVVRGGEKMDDSERLFSGKFGTLTENEAKTWTDFVLLCSSSILAGDKLSMLSPERKKLLADALSRTEDNSCVRLLDFWRGHSGDFPGMIVSGTRFGLFNWTDHVRTFRLPSGISSDQEGRSSLVLNESVCDFASIPDLELEPDSSPRSDIPFSGGNKALPLPLGPCAAVTLCTDCRTGGGILGGVYAPLAGKSSLLGVPMRIGPKAIEYRASDRTQSLSIPVGRTIHALYFLHAADFPVQGEWMKYIVRGRDGSEHVFPIVMGRDIGNTDWHYSVPWTSETARIAWTEPTDFRTMYLSEIVPDSPIDAESIILTHPEQSGTHILLAVSVR